MFDQVNFFPLRQDTVLNVSDEEEHFIRVNTDGKTAKFKLTKKDWELMEIKEYPSGGRLLGGAWTTIFRRGVKQSNEWCHLRLTNNQVRAENSRRMHSSPFFRGAGECKFPECNAKVITDRNVNGDVSASSSLPYAVCSEQTTRSPGFKLWTGKSVNR
ncbi:unnamed protein product [Porites evermanni]|uniref:Uncharacterized protein n=1 Tax=Porites evermanni TaxID=104178 RepID=A0ABN8LQU9_9CNID|nr:unnamed protein product [Porites evermanni]